MTYTDLINYFDSESAAAAAIGGSRQMVHNWGRNPNRAIPLDKQIAFEEASLGKLRADLSRATRSVLARVAA